MSIFTEKLIGLCTNAGYEITEKQLNLMYEYHKKMVNAPFNLTSVKEEGQSALKHFFDSIAIYKNIKAKSKVIDIGSGGGFPSVPLAIMREDITIYPLEASKKKCDFITDSCKELGITNIKVINKRAEEAGQGEDREKYDIALSRAVSALNILLELCAPLIKCGGEIYAYKGDYTQELQAGKQATQALNLKLEETIVVPTKELEHNILVFTKQKSTLHKYPRNYSAITKKPL